MSKNLQQLESINGATVKLRVCFILTVIWVGAACALGYFAHPASDANCNGTFSCLTANEWGDFLAGVFAPIALVWLVVTVWIQSDELREQRMELALTRNEFELSRAVMEEQAVEVRRQAEYLEKQTQLLAEEAHERKRASHLTSFLALIERYVEHSSESHASLARGGIFQAPIFAFAEEEMSNEKYISRQLEHFANTIRGTDVPVRIGGQENFEQAFKFLYSAEELVGKIPYHSRVSWQHSRLEPLLNCYCELVKTCEQLSHLLGHVHSRERRLQRLSSEQPQLS